MHFKQISLISLVIAFTAASPAQTNPKVLQAREHNKDRYINPRSPKMSLDEQCMKGADAGRLFTYWNVVINDASDYTDDTCGSGFFDNINGRGCAVTGWGCHYANDGKTMNAGFKAPNTCSDVDISSAINAAFGGKKVECADYDDQVKCGKDGCSIDKR
ncbi:hypothetical protein N7447_006152 [Penicillium robsamsonii]|uniref:uncharacterized protein n=1 Tax=Penicillium robsamsonii TaxID=1792511 RepID=UPI002547412D|nr:uncharacterized protein N7447_006152 [Penicillium robsamsonii]KAJ5823812.1 hypothetical protein N7447_006152 [Penicillium robsamsonii]